MNDAFNDARIEKRIDPNGEYIDLDRMTLKELSRQTAKDVREIKEQLCVINGTVRQHDVDIAVLKERTSSPSWIHSRQKVIGTGSLLVAVATLVGVAVAEFVKCFM